MTGCRRRESFGRRVRVLLSKAYDAGEHEVVRDGRNDQGQGVGSGVYFVKMASSRDTWSSKAVLVR